MGLKVYQTLLHEVRNLLPNFNTNLFAFTITRKREVDYFCHLEELCSSEVIL